MTMTAYSRRIRRDILACIADSIAIRGYAPTFREIGTRVGLASTSAVHRHVAELWRDGLVDYSPGLSRTLRVTDAGATALAESAA